MLLVYPTHTRWRQGTCKTNVAYFYAHLTYYVQPTTKLRFENLETFRIKRSKLLVVQHVHI